MSTLHFLLSPSAAAPSAAPQPVGCVPLNASQMLVDCGGKTVLIERSTGAVLASIESLGMTLVGVDVYGQVAIFSEDFSWQFQVYHLEQRQWLESGAGDLCRFVLEEDGEDVWISDLRTGDRYSLVEVLTPEEARRTA